MARIDSRQITLWIALVAAIAGCSSEPAGRDVASRSVVASEVNSAITNRLPVSPDDTTIKTIAPGIFQLKDVIIDQRQKTVRFPARLVLDEGPMEYFLVSTWGKTYESLFSTETEPQDIHVAMLLLGAKGAGTNLDAAMENSAAIVSHPSPERLPGDPVSIELKWQRKGKEMRRAAEELIFNARTKSVPHPGNWVYIGSFMMENTFLAEREGSIVSLVTDPQALINNIAPGHDDDSLWRANRRRLPPTNTVVEVTIRIGDVRGTSN